MRDMDKIIDAIVAIDENKLYIVAFVVIILIISYTLRWYFNFKDKRYMIKNLKQLSTSIDNLSGFVSVRTDKLTSVLEEIRNMQRNVISKSDSIKIIDDKFNNVVKKDVIETLEWSITNNHYESRYKFIKRKVKTALADIMISAKKSISEFKLSDSIDVDKFFATYINEKDKNIHLKIVDLIWDAVEETYHKDNYIGNNTDEILKQQIEEMKTNVSNIINTELIRVITEINDIYKDEE